MAKRNSDGTVTVRTVGRDKRGETGGAGMTARPGPLSAAPGIQGGGSAIRLVTKKTAVDRTAYR